MALKEAGFEQVKEKLSSVIKEMEIEAIDNSIVVSFSLQHNLCVSSEIMPKRPRKNSKIAVQFSIQNWFEFDIIRNDF